jgi:hypothetical protein
MDSIGSTQRTVGAGHDMHPSDYTFSRTRQDRLYIPLEVAPGLPAPWWLIAAEVILGAVWFGGMVYATCLL